MRDFVVKMVQKMFRTGFLVRASHTLLTWIITVVLFLHNTDLRRCEERGELLLPALFFLLVVLSVLLYFTVSLMDPGFVLTDTVKDVHSEESELMLPEASTSRLRRCGFCLLQQPMRAKHCQTCKRCVRRFDHHCPWMENCVGEKNHRWFIVYLLVQLLVLLWALQLRRLRRRHLGSVVPRQRVPAGGAGRGRAVLRGGGAAAGLPPLPGVRQLHHLGVHVAPPHLLPEGLRGRGEPVRPGGSLQPLGLLLRLQDGGLGEGLPEELPEPGLTSGPCFNGNMKVRR